MSHLSQFVRRSVPAVPARPSTRCALSVTALEARDQPSASPLDLTVGGSSGEINGALFQQVDTQPTGTGNIRSFVRIEGASAQHPVTQGYNTDARPLQFDEKSGHNFTRAIRLSDVPWVTVNGAVYRSFLLDINQRASQPLVSLDQVRLFVADRPDLNEYDDDAGTLDGWAPMYDMDATGDSWIKLNYRLNHGSGSGDMVMLLPNTIFAGLGPDPYVYLYSRFGEHYSPTAGFQEWAPGFGSFTVPPPPLPTVASLSGTVYEDLNFNDRRDAGEGGIGGVTIQLTGTDDRGPVFLETVTDGDGHYTFTELRAGRYEIFEVQHPAYLNGNTLVGTVNGTDPRGVVEDIKSDRISLIDLVGGEDGVNYDFTEIFDSND